MKKNTTGKHELRPNPKLKLIRALKGLTQFDLQHRSGVHHALLSMIECGHRQPTPEQRKKISSALGVRQEVVFSEEK